VTGADDRIDRPITEEIECNADGAPRLAANRHYWRFIHAKDLRSVMDGDGQISCVLIRQLGVQDVLVAHHPHRSPQLPCREHYPRDDSIRPVVAAHRVDGDTDLLLSRRKTQQRTPRRTGQEAAHV